MSTWCFAGWTDGGGGAASAGSSCDDGRDDRRALDERAIPVEHLSRRRRRRRVRASSSMRAARWRRWRQAAEDLGVEPTHVLLTHHHFDHVSELGALRKRWPKLEVLIHPLERELLAGDGRRRSARGWGSALKAGQTLRFGVLEVRPLRTPGHTAGMLSFLVSVPSARRLGRAGRATRRPDRARAALRAATRWCLPAIPCSRGPWAA